MPARPAAKMRDNDQRPRKHPAVEGRELCRRMPTVLTLRATRRDIKSGASTVSDGSPPATIGSGYAEPILGSLNPQAPSQCGPRIDAQTSPPRSLEGSGRTTDGFRPWKRG